MKNKAEGWDDLVYFPKEEKGSFPVKDWLLLGPFVVETEGRFEREYLFEREKILDIDYLEGEGGEACLEPEVGRAYYNSFRGPERVSIYLSS